jgi:hypothetical protein
MADDGIIFPPGMPEELQEAYRRWHDQQQANETVAKQQISRLFQELNADQLETVRFLMALCADTPAVATYYHGFAQAILAERFNKWPGSEEPTQFVQSDDGRTLIMMDLSALEDVATDVIGPEAVQEAKDNPLETLEKILPLLPDALRILGNIGEEGKDEPVDLPAMREEFGVRMTDPILENVNQDVPVTCNHCGTEYVSLADRALRSPGIEGCSGCIQKEKFG